MLVSSFVVSDDANSRFARFEGEAATCRLAVSMEKLQPAAYHVSGGTSRYFPCHCRVPRKSAYIDTFQCDEAKPVCKNCTRRQETCSYTGEDPRNVSSSHEHEVSPIATSPTSRSCPTVNAYNGLDLALMHRYSTVTSIHLFPTEGS